MIIQIEWFEGLITTLFLLVGVFALWLCFKEVTKDRWIR